MSKISIYDEVDGKEQRHLVLKIKESGDLEFEGQDLGPETEKLTGQDEYEYFLTVPAEYKDTILIHLIKQNFRDDSSFKKWLDEKQIPNKLTVI